MAGGQRRIDGPHLREIGEQVPAGNHALLVLDGACWHRSRELEIPANDSLLRLPPSGPEQKPVETICSPRQNRRFAGRAFGSTEHAKETVEDLRKERTRKIGEIMQITAIERAMP